MLLQICQQVNMSRWYINIIETGVELLIAKAWRGRVGGEVVWGGGVLFCPVHQVGNTSRSVPAQQLLNSLIKKLHILVLVWSRQVDDP